MAVLLGNCTLSVAARVLIKVSCPYSVDWDLFIIGFGREESLKDHQPPSYVISSSQPPSSLFALSGSPRGASALTRHLSSSHMLTCGAMTRALNYTFGLKGDGRLIP